LGGAAAIRFDGAQDYLEGNGLVNIPNNYTSFMVYEMDSGDPSEQMPSFVGVPGEDYGVGRGNWIPNGAMGLATWGDDYDSGYSIPAGTYRVWTDRFTQDTGLVELFDDILGSTIDLTTNLFGTGTPGEGYYVGGLDPSVGLVVSGRNFGGDIAELIYYSGAMTDSDRLNVLNYLEAKSLFEKSLFLSRDV
jgi:hypothetical protein